MARVKKENPQHGKKPHQKLKPYLVLQYLMRETDENNVRTADDVVAYLDEFYNISAERRSIYEDIKAINSALLALEEECTIEEAEEMLAEDDTGELKTIIYDASKKGFYVRQRHYDLNDIRLLAECVYSAKFVNEGQAKRLVNVVCEFVSEAQAERIKHNAFLTDRVKTNNAAVLNNISKINDAMSTRLAGKKHVPEKISFKYLKYTIGDMSKQVERRKGAEYIVNPFQLLINDGNYYLLAFDEKHKQRTFRVDRMKGVELTGVPRECQEEFDLIDMRTYAKRVFSMYSGRKTRIRIRFSNRLLDTVVERFGTKDVLYSQVDDRHFSAETEVEVSDQFYGWLLGFGKRAKILSPQSEIDGLNQYLDKVIENYK